MPTPFGHNLSKKIVALSERIPVVDRQGELLTGAGTIELLRSEGPVVSSPAP